MKISLKAARVNAKFKQTEVAETLHIHKTTLSSYENGKTMPDMDTALKMAELYGVSIDDISFCKAVSL
jgi:DNA-binding XRE family transcriptional regulator